MSHAEPVVGWIAGVSAIVGGLTGKRFYALGPGQKLTPTTRTIPRWIGAVWLCCFGAWLMRWSIRSLQGSWTRHDAAEGAWIAVFIGAVCALNFILEAIQKSNPPHEAQRLSLLSRPEEGSAPR